MKEVTVKVYKFEELNNEVKEGLIQSFRYTELHDDYMYLDVIDSAKSFSEGYEKTGYLMDILTEWSVFDGYGNGYVKFDGSIEVSRFIDDERFLEQVKQDVHLGNIDTKYLEYENMCRLLSFLDNNFNFNVYNYRTGYKCEAFYPYNFEEDLNKSLDSICVILCDIITLDSEDISSRLKRELEQVWDYLESDEYITECLVNCDLDYLEDGKVF